MCRWRCARALSDRKQKSDLRKMCHVNAGSWPELMGRERDRRPRSQSMTGQGTGDRDTKIPFKVADVMSSENLSLCWRILRLFIATLSSSTVVGFGTEASCQETIVAERSCHGGVDKQRAC